MQPRILALVVLALVSGALLYWAVGSYRQSRSPSSEEVVALIRSSPEFRQPKVRRLKLPINYVAACDVLERENVDTQYFRAAGIVDLQSLGTVPLVDRSIGCKVILTQKGTEVVSQAVSYGKDEWAVPVAHWDIVAVTAISEVNNGMATADFSWRWLPNEIGSHFKINGVASYAGTARLQRFSDGWRLVAGVIRVGEP